MGWSGNQWQHIFCTTHIDTFHMWDSEEVMYSINFYFLSQKHKDFESITFAWTILNHSTASKNHFKLFFYQVMSELHIYALAARF